MFYYEPCPVLIPRFPISINSIALHGLAFFSLWWLFVCFQLECEISATDLKSSSRAGDYGSEARLSALFPVRLVIPYLSSVLPSLHPAQSWPTLLACSGFNVQKYLHFYGASGAASRLCLSFNLGEIITILEYLTWRPPQASANILHIWSLEISAFQVVL
ncbi:hypothetical protein EDD85DRAFT_843013 [Armillaria nabsnona]|nr:hypothetical protein EDD85DRAFT_843013 [Armillaria nabsnona]